jgi:hypothetical protein
VTNITDFVSVGAGENQVNNRAMRNLLLLHLRKVNVAELPELPAYEEGHARLTNQEGQAGVGAAAEAAGRGLWSDVALQRQQPKQEKQQQQKQLEEQQQQEAGQGIEQQGEGSGQQANGVSAADTEQARPGQAAAAAAAAGAEKPARKRIRFADDV